MVGPAMGRQLFALAHNIDRRRVVTGVRRRSVGAQRALGRAGAATGAAVGGPAAPSFKLSAPECRSWHVPG